MYDLLEEEKLRPLVAKAMTDAYVSSNASYFETSCSFLHCIAARRKIIPYTDMVKWIIDVVDISDKEFKNHRKEVMGYLAKILWIMYHLPEP